MVVATAAAGKRTRAGESIAKTTTTPVVIYTVQIHVMGSIVPLSVSEEGKGEESGGDCDEHNHSLGNGPCDYSDIEELGHKRVAGWRL